MSWLLSCIGCGNKYLTERNEEKILEFQHCSLVSLPFEVFNSERFLEELYLDSNQISELSPSLFHCHDLRILSFSDNDVQVIPAAISNLINLSTLNFSKNSIADIPDDVKSCKRIQSLNASSNPLCRLPESLTQLTALKELCLNDTFLEYLPANFGRLSGLEVLELRENQLNSLPLSMSRLCNLKRIDIGQNEFTDLPDVIGHLSCLTDLWIDNNKISTITSIVGNLSNLLFLDASKNQIKDILPQIGNCKRLTNLYLNYNCIKFLPDEICNCSNLKFFNIDDNYVGFLPEYIGHLEHLMELSLCNNAISSFPTSCGLLRSLQILHLDNNKLELIPADIGSCGELVILTASHNRLSFLPAELGNLSKLRVVNFCRNKLQNLPVSFTKLQLKALWLSENQTKPLVPLHSIVNLDTGHKVLTCYILPQLHYNEEPSMSIGNEKPTLDNINEAKKTKNSIHFLSDQLQDHPGNLSRTPTPYPKELRALAKHTRNQALKKKFSALERVSVFSEEVDKTSSDCKEKPKDSLHAKTSDVDLSSMSNSLSFQELKSPKHLKRPASFATPEDVSADRKIDSTQKMRCQRPKSLSSYLNNNIGDSLYEYIPLTSSQNGMNISSLFLDKPISSDQVNLKKMSSFNSFQTSSFSNDCTTSIAIVSTFSDIRSKKSQSMQSNNLGSNVKDQLPDSELVSTINKVTESLKKDETAPFTSESIIFNATLSTSTHSTSSPNENDQLLFLRGHLNDPCVKVGQLTSPSKVNLHLSSNNCSNDNSLIFQANNESHTSRYSHIAQDSASMSKCTMPESKSKAFDSSNKVNDVLMNSRIPQRKPLTLSKSFNANAAQNFDESSVFQKDLRERHCIEPSHNREVSTKVPSKFASKLPLFVGLDNCHNVMKGKKQLSAKINISKDSGSDSILSNQSSSRMLSRKFDSQLSETSREKDLLPSCKKEVSEEEVLPMHKPINTTGIPLPSSSLGTASHRRSN